MAIMAVFKNGETKCYTKSVHQYDKGQRLMFIGVELPETFQVHLSTNKEGGIGTSYRATIEEGMMIPDEYLAMGDYIYAWIYLDGEEEDEGATIYSVTIPVIRRPNAIPVSAGFPVKGFELDDDHTLVVIPQ